MNDLVVSVWAPGSLILHLLILSSDKSLSLLDGFSYESWWLQPPRSQPDEMLLHLMSLSWRLLTGSVP